MRTCQFVDDWSEVTEDFLKEETTLRQVDAELLGKTNEWLFISVKNLYSGAHDHFGWVLLNKIRF